MMGDDPAASLPTLTDLPDDELEAYARDLGIHVDRSAARGELLRLIRERQELLIELDRDALLDVVVWARVPVRRSASKEELAKALAAVERGRFGGLSDRGLSAFARLHGLASTEGDTRKNIETRLRRKAGWWARMQRRRRAVVGSMIDRLVEDGQAEGEYRFLPEDDGKPSLRQTIEHVGVVGGIAQKLRGAADEYVHQKLDEIEQRIDRKLDEIDRRLGEWRDQEVKSRLRLIRITLISAIVVAVISLGYNYLKVRTQPPGRVPDPGASTVGADSVEHD
ncbi:MAG: hypothetical protein PVI86_03010 [Phycisphaerae bacterium]|jgi:hypothetical protein